MKRTPLARKTPLRPRRKKKGSSAAEKAHYAIIGSLPCVICGARPVHVHHIREAADGTNLGMGQRADYQDTIPLCPRHHQHGGPGVAYHAGPRAWTARYGSQRSLLEALRNWLNDPMASYPRAEAA